MCLISMCSANGEAQTPSIVEWMAVKYKSSSCCTEKQSEYGGEAVCLQN